MHMLREWSAQGGYRIWREQDAAALIDRFAAQHSTAALTAERAEGRRAGIEEAAQIAEKHRTRGRRSNVLDAQCRYIRDDIRALADSPPREGATAKRAEGRRAALEEAMQRLARICIDPLEEAMRRLMRIDINEAPAGMTQVEAANWAMGIARDEIRALADAPGTDG